MAEQNFIKKFYNAARNLVGLSSVPTMTQLQKVYGPAVTLGAPEEVRLAMDAQLCDAGVYSLIQHTFELGQMPMAEFVGYGMLQAMSQNGLLRACIETISDDMTRAWIKFERNIDGPDANNDGEITPEEKEELKQKEQESDTLIAEMTRTMEKYRLREKFHEARDLVGYEGGAMIFIDTGAVGEELKTPLTVKNYCDELKMGDLKGFVVIDPVNIFPGLYNASDPLKPDYFIPQTWWILGQEVHESRLIRLVDNEVPVLLRPSYNFMGIPQAQILWDYILHFQQCRHASADLITKHSTTVFKTAMGDILFSAEGAQKLDTRIQYFKQNRDNLNIVAIDKESEDLVNVDAPVTGVDMICKQALEYLAAINRTPAVKLLGISPSGFNATGESDLRNYYDHIRSQQEKVFRAGLQKCLDVLQLNLNGKIDPTLKFEFAPLSEEDKNSLVQYQKTKADIIGSLLDHQIISGEEARKALNDDPNSGFSGLDADEVPEGEEETPDIGSMMEQGENPEENVNSDGNNIDKMQSDGIIEITNEIEDGAPYGNTNASKNHVKRQNNGGPKKVRTVDELDPKAAYSYAVKGFRSQKKLDEHWDGNPRNGHKGHKDEYPGMTKQQYQAAMIKLLESPVGGDIDGHVDKRGCVVRYNKATNDFATGHPDIAAYSMYKPKDGVAYYQRQRKWDLDHGGKA